MEGAKLMIQHTDLLHPYCLIKRVGKYCLHAHLHKLRRSEDGKLVWEPAAIHTFRSPTPKEEVEAYVLLL